METGHLEMLMQLVRAHDPVIFAGPKESLLLEPEGVELRRVEETMQVALVK